MATVTHFQDQYRIYEVRQGSHGIRVIPERGGIITQWWQGEHQWLYLDQERLRDPQLTVRGGIPILFPICGALPGNAYTHGGTTYHLPQHGFARNLPWTVVDTEAGLTLALQDTPETQAGYPFAFELRFRYFFQDESLVIAQTYTNRGSQVMPFSISRREAPPSVRRTYGLRPAEANALAARSAWVGMRGGIPVL